MAILPSNRTVYLDKDGTVYRTDTNPEEPGERMINGKPEAEWLAEQMDLSRSRSIAAVQNKIRYDPPMLTGVDNSEPKSIYSSAPRRLIFKRGKYRVYSKT